MKKLAVMIMLILMIFTLTGCGGSFTCSFCGEEKTGKKYHGETWVYCEECYKGLIELMDSFGY